MARANSKQVMTEERNTKFTALGMTGSGKTCYIIGMHYIMASGEKGWTFKPDDYNTQDKLGRWGRTIDDNELGKDRFPTGSDAERADYYRFGLHYLNRPIMSFDWIDYAGSLIEQKSAELFNDVSKSIEESTALYIFIDGTELCHEELKTKIRNIKRHCSSYIQPCITDFLSTHDYIPPIIFVVTKSDLCLQYTNAEEIREILKESFSSLFYEPKAEVYITAVSLGQNISSDEYTGEVDPINVQLPIYIGIHHELVRQYNNFDDTTPSDKCVEYRKMISNLTDVISTMSNTFEIVEGDKNGGHTKPFDSEEWRAF